MRHALFIAILVCGIGICGSIAYVLRSQTVERCSHIADKALTGTPYNTELPAVQVDLHPADENESEQIDAIAKREKWGADRVPAEFRKIDCKNLAYRSALDLGRYRLSNGEFEKDIRDRGSKLPHHWSVSFRAVEYRDFLGRGHCQALVELVEVVSAGSSFGSVVYKLFEVKKGVVHEIWMTATGSESGCGHKWTTVEENNLILEVFGNCDQSGGTNRDKTTSDIYCDHTTRFTFGLKKNGFALLERKVFPFPDHNIWVAPPGQMLKNIVDAEYLSASK